MPDRHLWLHSFDCLGSSMYLCPRLVHVFRCTSLAWHHNDSRQVEVAMQVISPMSSCLCVVIMLQTQYNRPKTTLLQVTENQLQKHTRKLRRRLQALGLRWTWCSASSSMMYHFIHIELHPHLMLTPDFGFKSIYLAWHVRHVMYIQCLTDTPFVLSSCIHVWTISAH